MQCYFAIPNENSIIHTTLEGFTDNTLHSKLPIYIYNKIVNPADLLNTIFKYQHIYHVLSLSNSSILKKNLSKYLLIYNDSDTEDSVISIMHPHQAKELTYYNKFMYRKNYKVCNSQLSEEQKNSFIHIKIKPRNSIILPHEWIYNTNVNNILEIHIFDCITATKSVF